MLPQSNSFFFWEGSELFPSSGSGRGRMAVVCWQKPMAVAEDGSMVVWQWCTSGRKEKGKYVSLTNFKFPLVLCYCVTKQMLKAIQFSCPDLLPPPRDKWYHMKWNHIFVAFTWGFFKFSDFELSKFCSKMNECRFLSRGGRSNCPEIYL